MIRELSFDIGHGLYTVTKDNLCDKVGHTTYRTFLGNPQSNVATQKTDIEMAADGFFIIDVKTFLSENSKPEDKNKAIEDALENAKTLITSSYYVNKINDKGSYEVTLPSGKATVHVWETNHPCRELYKNSADVVVFMPDASTIVTVVASASNSATKRLFSTLKIGEVEITNC